MKPRELLKSYRQSKAFHAMVPVTCFANDHVFMTRHGDCGLALRVTGVDDECLTDSTLDALSDALMAAFKQFDERFRIYQYLIKRTGIEVPRKQTYPNEPVEQVIQDRVGHLEQNAALGTIELTLVIVYETRFGSKRSRPVKMSTPEMREEMAGAIDTLLAQSQSFVTRVSNPFAVRLLSKQEVFLFLRELLNLDAKKAAAVPLKRDTQVDYAAVASRLDWDHKGRLSLDDRQLKVLSLKELPKFTTPNLFRNLLSIDSDMILCSEWIRKENPQLRKAVTEKRRYLWNFKRFSAGTMLSAATNKKDQKEPDPDLEDDSARTLIRNLKDALRQIETEGGYFGKFSFTVLLHGVDLRKLAAASSEVSRVLTDFEAEGLEETYGALSAYLAMLPGNSKLNVRQQWLQNNHYADLAFFYAPYIGSTKASEIDDEYLTLFESRQGTPFFFDPYYNHSLGISIFGPRGTGKSVLANVLVSQAQKYGGYTFVLDLGGSFDENAKHFGGTVLKLSLNEQSFHINPFSLPPSPDNVEFIFSFLKLLMKTDGDSAWTYKEDDILHTTIQGMYQSYRGTPQLRLHTLWRLLPDYLAGRLAKWVEGGQYGVLFDHAEDTLHLSHFVAFDLQGVDEHEEIIEPLLYWILRQVKNVVHDPALMGTFKLIMMDELWKHLKNPTVVEFADLMIKTGRKHLVGAILATQSAGDLGPQTEMVLDNCKMQMFLANANFNREQYARLFQLSPKEMDLLARLRPREILLKTPDYSKVLKLTIDPKSYWRFTTSGLDRKKRAEAIQQHGDQAIELLAAGKI